MSVAELTNRLGVSILPRAAAGVTYQTNGGTFQMAGSDPRVYLPHEEWSPEKPVALQSTYADLRRNVTAVHVGSELISSFRSALPQMLDPAQTSAETRAEFLSSFGVAIGQRLLTQGIEIEEVRVCNVAVNKPGVRSTGRDFETNRRVGLHIDNHDRLPLAKRGDAIQLLAVNCGSAARHFRFVDLPVADLVRYCGLSLADENENVRTAANELKDRFLEMHPDFPVTSICLPPGFAYIATPQDVIHDGAGGSSLVADVTFLMLGRYRFVSNPSW